MDFIKKARGYIGVLGAALTAIGFFLPAFDMRVHADAPFVVTQTFLPLREATALGAACAILVNMSFLGAAAFLFARGKTADAKTAAAGFAGYFLLMFYITREGVCFVGIRFGFWFMALGCAMMLLAPGRAETPT